MRVRGRGFSLLEMMIAIVLVGVAILGLLGLFASGVELSARSRDLACATELAREVLEQVKNLNSQVGFGYIPSGTYLFDPTQDAPQGTPLFPPAPYPEAIVNNTHFLITVGGSEISPTLKELRVQVRWGESGNVVLETRLHR